MTDSRSRAANRQLTDRVDLGLRKHLGADIHPLMRHSTNDGRGSAIVVFAKRPISGRVKTRLTPRLSAEDASALYWAMVQDVWRNASGIEGLEPFLFVDEPWQGFDELASGAPVLLQSEGSLGMRMRSCFKYFKEHTFNKTLIIGTDSPTLPMSHLQTALDLLDEPHDAVLGPTEDGGYYLVGCREPRRGMFAGVPWSTHQTFEATLKSFAAEGYRTRLAPRWWDVDTFEDLERLAPEPVGPAVGAWLAENGFRAGKSAPRKGSQG